MRKPRSDSTLKTLHEERQDEIGALLLSRSLADVRATLKEQGLETSEAALSEFFSWYQIRRATRRREERISTLLQEVSERDPAITQDHLFQIGSTMFSTLAIAEEDGRQWAMTENTVTARMRAKTDQDKVCRDFMAWYRDERARQIMESEADDDSKVAAMRQLMFSGLAPMGANPEDHLDLPKS